MSHKKRRIFTDEQKAEAVRIALASDQWIGQVAREKEYINDPHHAK
jgi:transposase-like protein